MFWVFTLLFLAAAGGLLLFLRNRPNEKKIEQMVEEGNFEDAILEYSKLFDKRRLSKEGLWNLINLYIKTGRRKNAIKKLKYMLSNKLIPDNVQETDVKIKLASLLYDNKQDQEALNMLLEIYNSGEYVPEILKKIGTIAYSQNDYINAKKFLLKYIDIVQNDEEALELTSSALIYLGDIKQAINLYSNLTNIENKKYRHYYHLALCYLSILDFNKAFENFQKAIELGATSDNLINSYRGEFFCNIALKNFDQAVNNLDSAFSLILSPSIEDPELKDKIFVDKSLLYIFVGDIENKPYMINEMKNIVQGLDLSDENLKTEIIRLLKKDDSHYQPNDSNTKEEINIKEENQLNGKDLLLKNYPEDKVNVFIRWIEIGFPEEFITSDYNIERSDKFETKEMFENYSNKEDTEKQIQTPNIDKVMNTSKMKLSKIVKKVLNKIGLNIIDEIYVDEDSKMNLGDGIDFIAEEQSIEKNKYFIAFRRWNSDSIGDFAIRSIADTLKVIKFDKGIFIAPGKLSKESMAFLDKNQHIRFIGKRQLEKLLAAIDMNEMKEGVNS